MFTARASKLLAPRTIWVFANSLGSTTKSLHYLWEWTPETQPAKSTRKWTTKGPTLVNCSPAQIWWWLRLCTRCILPKPSSTKSTSKVQVHIPTTTCKQLQLPLASTAPAFRPSWPPPGIPSKRHSQSSASRPTFTTTSSSTCRILQAADIIISLWVRDSHGSSIRVRRRRGRLRGGRREGTGRMRGVIRRIVMSLWQCILILFIQLLMLEARFPASLCRFIRWADMVLQSVPIRGIRVIRIKNLGIWLQMKSNRNS